MNDRATSSSLETFPYKRVPIRECRKPQSQARAWETAVVLLTDYADRLTIQQHIECVIADIAGPDRAPLGVVAIAAQIIGERA